MSISTITAAVGALAFAVSASPVATYEPPVIEQLHPRVATAIRTDIQPQYVPPMICKLLPNLRGCEKYRPR